jgi:hypothetical protein
MDLREIGCGVDWIDMAQDKDQRRALVNTVLNVLEWLHNRRLLKKGSAP